MALSVRSPGFGPYNRQITVLSLLYQRLPVRQHGQLYAVHAVVGMRKSACLRYLCLCYAVSHGYTEDDNRKEYYSVRL